MKEIHIRIGLFAAALLAMLVGYHMLLLHHAPQVFADVKEDMSHGWYAPLFSLYVIWSERRKISASVGEPSILGLLLLVPFAFVGFLGVRGVQVRFEIVGFIGVLLGLVWSMFGIRTVRAVLFPVLFLLFSVPLHSYLDVVTIHLRLFTVSAAYEMLRGCGIDVIRQGTMLVSSTGSFAIDVADPCSGLRSLFAIMMIMAIYAYVMQPTWFRKCVLFGLSIPIAVIGNIVRIFSIVLVATFFPPDWATGYYHDYSPFAVYLAAIWLMVLADRLITRISMRCANS